MDDFPHDTLRDVSQMLLELCRQRLKLRPQRAILKRRRRPDLHGASMLPPHAEASFSVKTPLVDGLRGSRRPDLGQSSGPFEAYNFLMPIDPLISSQDIADQAAQMSIVVTDAAGASACLEIAVLPTSP